MTKYGDGLQPHRDPSTNNYHQAAADSKECAYQSVPKVFNSEVVRRFLSAMRGFRKQLRRVWNGRSSY